MKERKNSLKNSLVKQVLCCVLVLYLVFTLIPAAIYFLSKSENVLESESTTESQMLPESSEIEEVEADDGENENSGEIPGFLDNVNYQQPISATSTAVTETAESFNIYDKALDTVLKVSAEEFLPAAVICEMPPTAPEEALKAQAVAAYTYYSWQKKYGDGENWDFSCDTSSWNVYVTQEQMKERWGEDFDQYYSKVKFASDSVLGEALTAGGDLICSTYFAISNGSTEASENVWGGERSYLQTVASPGDKLSDGYLSYNTFSKSEFQEKISTGLPGKDFDFSLPQESWLENQQLSRAGYTNTIDVCGVNLKGIELRTALGLSSTSFTVETNGENFVFSVKGYGHGVGMSQVGAMFMAQQGRDYKEILSHYYIGTDISG